jgi:hypothetical protein
LSKGADDPVHGPACRQGLARLAEAVAGLPPERLRQMDNQALANLVNGLSKGADDPVHGPACREGLARLAEAVAGLDLERLRQTNDRYLSNLVNGLSKAIDDPVHGPACRKGLARLAEAVAGLPLERLRKMGNQALAILANGLSKGTEDPVHGAACREGLTRLAETVAGLPLERVRQMDNQALTILANGWSKAIDDPAAGAACRQALLTLIPCFTDAWVAGATNQHLAVVSNALGRLAAWGEPPQAAYLEAVQPVLRQVTARLTGPEALAAQLGVLHLSNIQNALHRAGLFDALAQLAPAFLDRVKALLAQTALRDCNLQTVGTLHEALLALLAHPELDDVRLQAARLALDPALQASVERKLDLFLAQRAGTADGPADEPCGTRIPAYTVSQILKCGLWSRSLLKIRERRQARQWLEKLWGKTEELLTNDASPVSWNLVAQLDQLVRHTPGNRLLDEFIQTRFAQLHGTQALQPTGFDFMAAWRQLDHALLQPRGEAAEHFRTEVLYYHFNGNPLLVNGVQRREVRYTLWGLLMQGRLPLRLVALPARMGMLMLGRIIYIEVDGRRVPHRIDVLGGSKMKAPTLQVDAYFDADDSGRPVRHHGYLAAVPLADTQPGTPFEAFMKFAFQAEQSYFYAQRMFYPSPLEGIRGLEPTDHLLAGRFNIGWLATRGADEPHPFKIGNTLLRPHDGLGFIPERTARKMGWYGKMQAQWQAGTLLPYGGTTPSGNLASQALQFYPRAEDAAAEIVAALDAKIAAGEPLQKEELFRAIVSGSHKGHMGIAVPTDEQAVLPRHKGAADAQAHGEYITARAPFTQAALTLVPTGDEERVLRTQELLEQEPLLQYSFGAMDQVSGAFLGFKGLLQVVPDALFDQNADWAGCDLVLNQDDLKLKPLPAEPELPQGDGRSMAWGVLHATEAYQGSAFGEPVAAQARKGGDFDGDPLLALPATPAMRGMIQAMEAQLREEEAQTQQAIDGRAFKSVKKKTPAIKDGRYQFGRAPQIAAGRSSLLPRATTAQAALLAAPPATQQLLAQRAVFEVYEGWPRTLRQAVWHLLDEAQPPEDLDEDEDEDDAGDAAAPDALATAVLTLRDQLRDFDREAVPAMRALNRLLWEELTHWAGQEELARPAITWAPGAPDDTSALLQVRPQLAAARARHTPGSVESIKELLRHAPQQLLERATSISYVPGNAHRTLQRLLTEAITRGTDAPKAPDGVEHYLKVVEAIQRVLAQHQVPLSVPYSKGLAGTLARGELDVHRTLTQLAPNPTLAAQVMEMALSRLQQHGYLDAKPGAVRRGQPNAAARGIRPQAPRPGKRTPFVLPAFNPEADALLALAQMAEPLARERLAQAVAGLDGIDELDWQDRIKSDVAVKQKIQRLMQQEGVGFMAAAARLQDVLRFALRVDDEAHFGAVVQALLDRLAAQGLEIGAPEVRFAENAPYKGVHVNLGLPLAAAPGGRYVFELQFHTAASYAAKQKNHATYRQWAYASLGAQEREAHEQRMRDVSRAVPTPGALERLRHAVPKPARAPADALAQAAALARFVDHLLARKHAREPGQVPAARCDRPHEGCAALYLGAGTGHLHRTVAQTGPGHRRTRHAGAAALPGL